MHKTKYEEYVRLIRDIYKRMHTKELFEVRKQWKALQDEGSTKAKVRIKFIEEELILRGEFIHED